MADDSSFESPAIDPAIDPTADARPGEELDTVRLAAFLAAAAPQLGVRTADDIAVRQFPSGHSNLTYLLTLGGPGSPPAQRTDVVLRRPPFGASAKGGHDMGREFRILSALQGVYPHAPEPLVFCDDHDVLGSDFYLMRRITGVIIRASLPDGVPSDPTTMRRLSEHLVDELVAIHAVDLDAAGLADFGLPVGYVHRQIDGWTKRWDAARTPEVESGDTQIDRVAAWLAANEPPERGATLIHNDLKYDNLVLDPTDVTRIIGVLDWEMATVGDPLMDLGSTLGYWVQPGDPAALVQSGFGPTAMPGSLTRRQIVERYAEQTGRSVDDVRFYYAYAIWKLAVVLQQIYARFVKGNTADERFAGFAQMVALLGDTAADVIERPDPLEPRG